MAGAHHAATVAKVATKRSAAQPWLEFLERVGYVVRGVLYAAMGVFALGLALGLGGTATDQRGSLVILTGGTAGRVLLFAVVIGLGAFSTWGFVRAVFDPLNRGTDPSGIAERLGFAWSGFAYLSIVFFALHLLAGSASDASHDSTHETIARILSYPLGQTAAVVIGVVAVSAGLGQLLEAIRGRFRRDLKRSEMTGAEKKTVDLLGRIGMVSRGVVFSLVGWFILEGAVNRDPSRVHGFGYAFLFLLEQPYGRVLLGVVSLGFIALGLHSSASARWIRLLGSGPG